MTSGVRCFDNDVKKPPKIRFSEATTERKEDQFEDTSLADSRQFVIDFRLKMNRPGVSSSSDVRMVSNGGNINK